MKRRSKIYGGWRGWSRTGGETSGGEGSRLLRAMAKKAEAEMSKKSYEASLARLRNVLDPIGGRLMAAFPKQPAKYPTKKLSHGSMARGLKEHGSLMIGGKGQHGGMSAGKRHRVDWPSTWKTAARVKKAVKLAKGYRTFTVMRSPKTLMVMRAEGLTHVKVPASRKQIQGAMSYLHQGSVRPAKRKAMKRSVGGTIRVKGHLTRTAKGKTARVKAHVRKRRR